MKVRMTSIGMLLTINIIAACGRGAAAPQPLSRQDSTAILAIANGDSALLMSRSWDAMAALYAPAAVRMPPSQPAVVGREAIRRSFEQLPPVTGFAFRVVDLQGSGNLAYLRGSWSITAAPAGMAPTSDSGKILVVLQRQADGNWLVVADAWNSDAASPPPGR